jgi:hypothetical protein
MNKKIKLNAEIADGIALAVLKQHRDYLKKQLKQWKKNPHSDTNPNGYWMHAEDIGVNTQHIAALETIIKYFGVEE